MAILRGFFQHVPKKSKLFLKKDENRTILRGASSSSHAVSDFEVVFFDTLSCFASVGLRVLECSKTRRMGNFTREITILRYQFEPKNPPPPGRFPVYYVPSSRTVSKKTPLEEPGTNFSKGVLLLTVLDQGT